MAIQGKHVSGWVAGAKTMKQEFVEEADAQREGWMHWVRVKEDPTMQGLCFDPEMGNGWRVLNRGVTWSDLPLTQQLKTDNRGARVKTKGISEGASNHPSEQCSGFWQHVGSEGGAKWSNSGSAVFGRQHLQDLVSDWM